MYKNVYIFVTARRTQQLNLVRLRHWDCGIISIIMYMIVVFYILQFLV